MFHWGKKQSEYMGPVPVDLNAPITPDETATVLRLAEMVPLVSPRQILIMLRQNGGSTDSCIEKLLALQNQFEQHQAAERRILEESAAKAAHLAASKSVDPAPQPAPLISSIPLSDEEKINAVKKVTDQLAALERMYESSFEVMEKKLRDLQMENEAQRAEIALLHQQLQEKDKELDSVRKEMRRPPSSAQVADEVMRDVTQRFEDAYISAFDDGRQADELVRSFGQLMRRKLAMELMKGTGEISERDFIKLDAEPRNPAPSKPAVHQAPPAPAVSHQHINVPQPQPHPMQFGQAQRPYVVVAQHGQMPNVPVYSGVMPILQQHPGNHQPHHHMQPQQQQRHIHQHQRHDGAQPSPF